MLLQYTVKYECSKFTLNTVTTIAYHMHIHNWECGCGSWAGIKPRRLATNSSFNMPSNTVCCRMEQFFTAILTPTEDMTEAIHYAW